MNKDFRRNRKELDLLRPGLVKSWEIPWRDSPGRDKRETNRTGGESFLGVWMSRLEGGKSVSSGLLKISAIEFVPFSDSNKIRSDNQLDG